ncbi:hypothetical protein DOV67_15190 [Salmonella enterica subsp. enterica serovar Java]|uniref:Uncharacterized protein n=1 Tax=Salmonella enterica subsp. enterica serovar Java TaxID=224729 RepID=A0A5U8K2I4_SALEB|nr:hypothetical protein [Salmonella enterica subsp. enterica serovar Java]
MNEEQLGVPCPFAPKVPHPEKNFIYINKIHFIFVVCFKVSYVVISETAFIGLKRGIEYRFLPILIRNGIKNDF